MRITLSGHDRIEARPERATLHLEAAREGTDRARVVAETRRIASALQSEIEALKVDGGPATQATTGAISVRSWVPTDRDGHPQEPRHAASIAMTVEFADFDDLGARAFDRSSRDGVTVGHIDWDLTDDTRSDLEERALTGALRDAPRRARVLAGAAGEGDVHTVEIADHGMLHCGPGDGGTQPRMARMMVGSAAGGGGEDVRVEPEDVSVEARIDVVFEA